MGYKFIPDRPIVPQGKFGLYFTDAIGLEYQVIRGVGNNKKVFFINNTGDFLACGDETFTTRTENHLSNLLKTATLISEINEKKKNLIFNNFQMQFDELR